MKGILISLIAIMLLFNFIYATTSSEVTNNIVVGAVTGLLTTSIVTGVLSGFTLFGSGLNSESVKIVFGTTAFINILFQINLGGYPIGLGLGTRMISVFEPNTMAGIPYFGSWLVVILTLIMGIMILIE